MDIQKRWQKRNALSITYLVLYMGGGHRGGCWFCPNCKIKTFAEFRKKHSHLWGELVELSKTPNLCSYGFKYGMTVQEIQARMDAEDAQLKLF